MRDRRHEPASSAGDRITADGTRTEQRRASDERATTDADAVVYDGQLRPGQYAGLVERLPDGTRVIDRYRLVLSIFAAGAGARAARLQVEAARLRYELPRLRQTSDESLLNRATEKGSPVLDYERRIDRLENRLAELTATAGRRRGAASRVSLRPERGAAGGTLEDVPAPRARVCRSADERHACV